MLIPREDDKVRMYVELGTEDELEKDDHGRPDTSVFTPEKMLDITRTAFKPYIFETTLESVEWWTAYVGAPRFAARIFFTPADIAAVLLATSRPASCRQVRPQWASVYRRGRMPYPLAERRTGHERQHQRRAQPRYIPNPY